MAFNGASGVDVEPCRAGREPLSLVVPPIFFLLKFFFVPIAASTPHYGHFSSIGVTRAGVNQVVVEVALCPKPASRV